MREIGFCFWLELACDYEAIPWKMLSHPWEHVQLLLIGRHLCVVLQVLHGNAARTEPDRIVAINLSQTIWPKNPVTARQISWMCPFIRWCAVQWSVNYGTAFESYINCPIMDCWYGCFCFLLRGFRCLTTTCTVRNPLFPLFFYSNQKNIIVPTFFRWCILIQLFYMLVARSLRPCRCCVNAFHASYVSPKMIK